MKIRTRGDLVALKRLGERAYGGVDFLGDEETPRKPCLESRQVFIFRKATSQGLRKKMFSDGGT